MSERKVVVTGLGIICPIGNDVAAAWESAISGKHGFGPITHFDASELKTNFAAEVKNFDPNELFGTREARRMDRFTQFMIAAAL